MHPLAPPPLLYIVIFSPFRRNLEDAYRPPPHTPLSMDVSFRPEAALKRTPPLRQIVYFPPGASLERTFRALVLVELLSLTHDDAAAFDRRR